MNYEKEKGKNRNKGVDIAKKNELYALIGVVGKAWGEDLEDLRSYAKFVATEWINRLDEAILCFRDLKNQCIDLEKLKTIDEK